MNYKLIFSFMLLFGLVLPITTHAAPNTANVQYTSNGILGAATGTVSINEVGNYKSGYFAGSAGGSDCGAALPTSNYIQAAGGTAKSSNCVHFPFGSNYSSVGYNTINVGQGKLSNGGTYQSVPLVGIWANVIYNNGQQFTGTSIGLNWNSPVTNSVVIFGITDAGDTFTTSNIPTGCVQQQSKSTATTAQATIWMCDPIQKTTGNVVITFGSLEAVFGSAAWVFPPYNVIMQDTNSDPNGKTGNVVLGGTTFTTGQQGNYIGTFTLNAVIPKGYSFGGWTTDASGTANFIIANNAAANTSITIMGNGIITASFIDPTIACVPHLPATMAVGQNNVTCTATWTSFTAVNGYTANFIGYNSISNVIVFNSMQVVSNTLLVNTISFNVPQNFLGNSITFNVIIGNVLSPFQAFSGNVGILTVQQGSGSFTCTSPLLSTSFTKGLAYLYSDPSNILTVYERGSGNFISFSVNSPPTTTFSVLENASSVAGAYASVDGIPVNNGYFMSDWNSSAAPIFHERCISFPIPAITAANNIVVTQTGNSFTIGNTVILATPNPTITGVNGIIVTQVGNTYTLSVTLLFANSITGTLSANVYTLGNTITTFPFALTSCSGQNSITAVVSGTACNIGNSIVTGFVNLAGQNALITCSGDSCTLNSINNGVTGIFVTNSLTASSNTGNVLLGNIIISSGGGGGGGGTTYTFTFPLTVSPSNVVSLQYSGNFFLNPSNQLDFKAFSCVFLVCSLNNLFGNVAITGAGNAVISTSGQNVVVTVSGGGGGGGTQDLANADAGIVLVIAAIGLWGIGIYQRALRIFRIFFIALGFLLFTVALTISGTIFAAYVVPAGQSTPYYTQATINGLSSISFAMQYAVAVMAILYVGVEVILYFRSLTILASQKKKNRLDEPYKE